MAKGKITKGQTMIDKTYT